MGIEIRAKLLHSELSRKKARPTFIEAEDLKMRFSPMCTQLLGIATALPCVHRLSEILPLYVLDEANMTEATERDVTKCNIFHLINIFTFSITI